MAKKKMKFEDALRRLEEISKALESDETTLDEMISLYEEGMKLAEFCYEELKQAELKIEKLSDKISATTTENDERESGDDIDDLLF
jgi:exodeoxyribonuclease VII small subunit